MYSPPPTTLLLNSWRAKTNKSYDSLFGKWHSWCVERSFDPFSGPVANVANFQAHLYAKGYQYTGVVQLIPIATMWDSTHLYPDY